MRRPQPGVIAVPTSPGSPAADRVGRILDSKGGPPAVILLRAPGGQHRLAVAVPRLPPPGTVQAAPGTRMLVEGVLPARGVFGAVVEPAPAGAGARVVEVVMSSGSNCPPVPGTGGTVMSPADQVSVWR